MASGNREELIAALRRIDEGGRRKLFDPQVERVQVWTDEQAARAIEAAKVKNAREAAITETLRDHRKNLKAFNIGRKLALEPRALPNRPEASTWEHLVTAKTRILRKTRLFGRG